MKQEIVTKPSGRHAKGTRSQALAGLCEQGGLTENSAENTKSRIKRLRLSDSTNYIIAHFGGF